jgi:hypothetical protein
VMFRACVALSSGSLPSSVQATGQAIGVRV